MRDDAMAWFRRLLLATLCLSLLASSPVSAGREFGETTLFARVPDPGHPFGVLVGDRHVYVVTSRGFHLESMGDGERLFTFTRSGSLVSARRVDPASPDMGLYGLALDGERRLYVSDMNGRVLRYGLAAGLPTGQEQIYARTPPPYSLGWQTSMWNGLAFDPEGNLYVADNAAAIWKIPPDGDPEVWFRDPRLAGGVGGPFGAALGPDGKLYVAVLGPTLTGSSTIYRLPVVDHPSAADLEQFHTFPATADEPIPLAAALVFGKSGRAYVALSGTAEIAVLSPSGAEVRRIPLPGAREPLSLSFMGQSLLVTSATNFFPIDDPESWKIVKVWVGERGMPVVRP